MDDRHYFSDPRPVDDDDDCDIPTWQVDVFRQGVEEPVFTLLIDKNTLPPRTRKKRVVWKLPDSTNEVPNFGSDERKRLLELFKKQKKTRKKQLKRTSSVHNQQEDATTAASSSRQCQAASQEKDHHGNEGPAKPLQGEHEEPQRITQHDEVELALEEDSDAMELPPTSNACAAAPPGIHVRHNNNGLDDNWVEPRRSNGHSHVVDPPIPPPGFDTLGLKDDDVAQDEPSSSTTTTTPANNSRFFVVPSVSTNIPVDLAKIVVDIYYPGIAHKRSNELAMYYAHDAQKSLSIGGAHAVCSNAQDDGGNNNNDGPSLLLLQLQSLQGSEFLVRGVVAQPGIQDSVFMLITGSVQTTTLQLLPFCHSLTLIPIERHQCHFQIRNDAMALLTE